MKHKAFSLILSSALLGIAGATAMAANLSSPLAQTSHVNDRFSASESGVVYSQNIVQGRVLFIDLDSNARVVDFSTADVWPGQCTLLSSNEQSCILIGGQYVNMDDHDYVVFAATDLAGLFTTIARVPITEPHTPVWQLKSLDFSGVVSDGRCTKACGDPGPIPAACHPGEVHEVHVVAEDPEAKWVEVVAADLLNSRLVKARLDYTNDNTCAQVEWVLDESNPDWPDGHPLPNGFQLLHEPEGEFMVVTFHTEEPVLMGSGRVHLWDLNGDVPSLIWAFPEGSSQQRPYLNTVHHGLIQTDPITGDRFLLYGHSFGESRMWGTGTGGSLGIARVDDIYSSPDYLLEWVLDDPYDNLDFPRELEILPDGTFFGVDAGCYLVPFTNLPCPAQLYWFDRTELTNSDKSGIFTLRHREQDFVSIPEENVSREMTCGLHMLFEADVIPYSDIGSDLRAAIAEGGVSCGE